MVVLVTDALLFLLLAGVAAYAVFVWRSPHLRTTWGEVGRQPAAASAAVVLLLFVAVTVLDSLHFHPRLDSGVRSGEIRSVLDELVGPLRTQAEKTYSAPFAWQAYSKEVRATAQGKVQEYPRLQYGGAHLRDPARERAADIGLRAASGAFSGALAWIALMLVLLLCAVRSLRGLPAYVRDAWRGRAKWPWRSVGVTLLFLCVLLGIVAHLAGAYHMLGTDKVGEDVLYQSIKSIRTGVLIGTLTTVFMLPFALALGAIAGYYRGWADDVIQYLYITLNSIPSVLLIAAAILSLHVYLNTHQAEYTSLTERADLRLLFLCLILGLTSWTGLCRLLRGETLKLREQEYVQAAVALGVPGPRIVWRHLVPNVMHIVLITVTLDFSGLVLAEAVLSYVDIGVDPTMDSWGNMINSARLEMSREPVVWWSLAAAFGFMFLLVLSANLLADAVRDAFDPRVQA